ncbi:MAG TPA: OB-fold nucleic acid binding domain-containing protein [Thermoflexales bacterium]|nr:OB-fold nucleic acid binding domain-containing protein [Thermoflexales bacterium]HQW36916.1 OB-fold nucleic acid binding domain-containing protein [Thermoflexales bacterium]HQZ21972.1 OB-fold nucleic acid binding domain-containing protein [Thermoflexales bacterium]
MKRVIALVFLCVWLMGVSAGDVFAAESVLPIGKITTEYKDKYVTVQGTVSAVSRFSAGMRYTLGDDTGKVTLVVFDKTLASIKSPEALDVGAELRVNARVDVYQGKVELALNKAKDLTVLKPAPVATNALARIGELTPADKGKLVTLEGVVINTASFSAGFKFTLNDGSGQMVMTLFESAYDKLAKREALNLGAKVRVKGRLDAYNNQLEIAPNAADVSVSAGTPPAIQNYALGAISGNDHNALAQVSGEIAGVEKFADGVNLIVKDATGVQKIVLYTNIAKRIPAGVKLTAGSKISVIGRIKASRASGIRIEVALPYDVKNVK